MNELKLSKWESGGILISVLLISALALAYAFLCFHAPANKWLAISAGIAIIGSLLYHIGRVVTIFKLKKTVARAEYLANYPLGVSAISGLFAFFSLGIISFSTETKIIWAMTLLVVSLFNGILTWKLFKKN